MSVLDKRLPDFRAFSERFPEYSSAEEYINDNSTEADSQEDFEFIKGHWNKPWSKEEREEIYRRLN